MLQRYTTMLKGLATMLQRYGSRLLEWLGRPKTQTPVILQMDVTECGAAALASILAYYKCYVSLEALRVHCEVSRHGSSAEMLLKAARYYGMEAQAETAEPEDLYEVTLPAIAHWKFEHFIVIERLTPSGIDINDPSMGHRHISWETFDEDFTGVILLFTPGPNFKPLAQRFSILDSITTRLQQGKPALIFIFLLSLALIVPGIIIPGFTMIFINQILIDHLHSWLIPLLFGLFLTAIFRALFSLLQQYIILKMRMTLALSSSMSFVRHLLALPIDFFQKRSAGDVIERVSANDRVASLLSNELITNLVGLISMIFFAIVMFFYNWQLTLLVIFITLINAVVFYKQSTTLAENSRTFLQHRGRLQGIEMNYVSMIESMKAEALEDYSFIRWSSVFTKMMNSAYKMTLASQKLLLSSYMSHGITNLILITLGCYFIIQGKLTIGALIALQSLTVSFQEPLDALLKLGDNIQKIRGDFQRLDDILHQPIDPFLLGDKIVPTNLSGSVQLNEVTFGYSKYEPPIINHLSLAITAQTHIAIVGPTGSGKSTVAKLLSGLYQPWQGKVVYDDYLLPMLDAHCFSHTFAMVDQDIVIFSGTIRDNLTLWDKSITDEVLIQALKDAILYDELNKKNLGFCLNIVLHEDGTNLSAGQRQRLEIARALVKNPKVLLLDEATSHLDTITEALILTNLKKRSMTMIIISHRLSIIKDCHCIYLFSEGCIVDSGPHEDLIEKNAIYAKLVALENDIHDT